ncbi:MAG: RimK/LysX family protein, partial [Candidatus Paceibacterota bacterium]
KRAIRLAKDLFGGEIEEEIEEITGRQVIGLIEEITLFGKDNQKETILAKVDTGAGKTSIDEKLALTLGYESVLEHMKKFKIKPVLTADEINELSKNKVWQKIEEHPDIVGVSKVRSSHGYSYRPIVYIKIKVGDDVFETKANIIARSSLEYPMILGENSLKRFIIDPRK